MVIHATVLKGPFELTSDLVAGYWIWEVKEMDEAIRWLKRCPNPHPDICEVEIRPLFEPEDFTNGNPDLTTVRWSIMTSGITKETYSRSFSFDDHGSQQGTSTTLIS